MALLLRMGGVPARVVTGFSPGGYSERKHAWIVRDTDAHSWVEAWFDGLGWVTFDPTPSATPARSQIAALERPDEADDSEGARRGRRRGRLGAAHGRRAAGSARRRGRPGRRRVGRLGGGRRGRRLVLVRAAPGSRWSRWCRGSCCGCGGGASGRPRRSTARSPSWRRALRRIGGRPEAASTTLLAARAAGRPVARRGRLPARAAGRALRAARRAADLARAAGAAARAGPRARPAGEAAGAARAAAVARLSGGGHAGERQRRALREGPVAAARRPGPCALRCVLGRAYRDKPATQRCRGGLRCVAS